MDTTRRGFLRASAGLMAIGFTGGLALAQSGAVKAPEAPKPMEKPPAKDGDKPPEMFSGPLAIVKLDDDLYFIDGAGGNTVVHFDKDRLLVIDSGVPKRGKDLAAAAAKLAPDAKLKTLFNTHWHFDHAGGNGDFVSAGYTIIASANCRARLSQKITFEALGMTFEPAPELQRPAITFEDKVKLHAPTAVAITKIAPAHTDTDAVAFFEKHNVLHTGDLLFSGMFPVIDVSTGGSLDGMIASSKQLHGMCDDKTRVVAGHGPVGDRKALMAQHDLLQKVREKLAPLAAKKMTMEEVLAAKPLAEFDEKWGKGFLQSPLFTQMAYGQWVKK